VELAALRMSGTPSPSPTQMPLTSSPLPRGERQGEGGERIKVRGKGAGR